MLMVNVKGEMIFRMQSHTALYIDLTLYMHALPCTFTVVNHWFTIITDYKLGVELIIMSARNCCVPNHVTDLFTDQWQRICEQHSMFLTQNASIVLKSIQIHITIS